MAAKVEFSPKHLSPEYRRPTVDEFYESYRPYTLRSVINSGVNPSDAEDVVHEIFIKFLYGGYYESYDCKTNVSFKNFYRHVMKLYLRGMAESLHLKSSRIDLLDTVQMTNLRDATPRGAGHYFEDPEASEFEFKDMVEGRSAALTDEQSVVLMTVAHLALDRAPRITMKEVSRECGVSFRAVKLCYEAIASVL